MIKLESVSKIYQTERIETIALANINLQVERGEFISVMGPSGCGKTTMLNIMGLLDAPSEGAIHIADRPIEACGDRQLAQIRNHNIGFIFQNFHLIADLSVRDNVSLPLLYRKSSARDRKYRASEALTRVGLSARMNHFPTQLSGGQQQRVAIARAIVGSPKILLADEPTGNLDSQMGNEIMKILEELNNEQETTIVMVTHDAQLAKRTHRTVRIFDGQQVG